MNDDYETLESLYLWARTMLPLAKKCIKHEYQISPDDTESNELYIAGYFTGTKETLETIIGELEDHIREAEKRPRL